MAQQKKKKKTNKKNPKNLLVFRALNQLVGKEDSRGLGYV